MISLFNRMEQPSLFMVLSLTPAQSETFLAATQLSGLVLPVCWVYIIRVSKGQKEDQQRTRTLNNINANLKAMFYAFYRNWRKLDFARVGTGKQFSLPLKEVKAKLEGFSIGR